MTRKLSRIFFLSLISIIASFGIYRIVEACADWEVSDNDVHSVYSQDIIGKTPYYPYLYTAFDYYSSAATAWDSTINEPSNVSDWKAEIGGNATEADITQLVYNSTGKDISELIKHFMNNKAPLNDKWKNNTAVLQLKNAKDVETLEYLAYAKQCEPHVTGDYNEWEPVERNKTAMNALIASGQKSYDKVKKESLKIRYAYQMVRLAHYSNQYDQALKLYDKMFGKVQRKSDLSYRAYAIKGGANFRKGNKSQSRYIFSRLFDEFPSMREIAMRNFNWATYEGSRNEGIEYCKTGHEKATIWFMDAYFRDHAEYLPFMESIYREEPGSEYLDILLARYIALMQHTSMPWRYSGSGAIDMKDSIKGKSEEEKFMEKCVAEGKVKRPYLWEFSLGYISYLKKNNNDARQHFNKARSLAPGDQLVNDQVRFMEILLKLQETEKIDTKFERVIVSDLQWLALYKGPLKATDARSFIMLQMSDKYKAQGNSSRSALCLSASYGGKDLLYNPNTEPIDELIAFKKKKKKSEFEAILDTSFTVSLSKLHEIKGTMFLGKHQLEEAVKEFEMCEAKDIDSLPADPFFIRIRDCHDCDFELPKATVYTKLSLSKKMVQMHKDVLKKPDAKNYFDLANAYYNLTYYGNSWMGLAYGRWNWHTPWDNYEAPGVAGPAQYFNCMKTLEYYRKAMEAADSDRELAAKACYMASKCEQNEFYNLGKPDDEKTLNETYRTYFRELKDKYSDTKYYQEVIKECSYFREFVKK